MQFTKMYVLDPLTDKRWDDLVESHPRASVFHHSGWLRALASTYGYKPLVLTETRAGGPLKSGIPFCIVKSWMTGHRLVSLPFADHCEPLFSDSLDEMELAHWLREVFVQQKLRYVEMRPLMWSSNRSCPLHASTQYWFHTLDLTNSLEKIFRGFHKNSIQRRIQHAEREQVVYECGSSARQVSDFYRLQVLTRRRHQLLPQPLAWFRNLTNAMGDNLKLHVASKHGLPIAAILTLSHGNTTVYKYGCSDARFHKLGGMPFLFWRLIEQSKAEGGERIDFGRTEMSNDGLRVFKERLGAKCQQGTYMRYPEPEVRRRAMADWPALRSLVSFIPNALSPWLGRLAYRHLG